jgi:hypothetical protein
MTRLRPPVLVLLAALAAAPGPRPAAAQDLPEKGKGGGLDGEAAKPLTPEEQKAAMALFAKAKALVEKGQGIQAAPLFEKFIDDYPGAEEDLLREADDRSGDNMLAGIVLQHEAGPSARRLDFELMADGYTKELYRRFEGEALSHMKQFWAEPLYAEYANYINIWRFDLISFQEGVDDVSMEDKGIPPPTDPKKLKRWEKAKKRLKQYSTALNCKAAGPGGQVMADSEQVLRWRRYLKESDGQTIAFARRGSLGMGGGGIATTGRNVALVHEVGHAFIGLLDEYTNNPGRPSGRVFAPNAVSTSSEDPKEPPPLDEIPWKHWLLYKPKPGDVGIHLGGATYVLGVFRPAPGCAMNSGGSSPLCTVCREAGVLRIYSYVNPIDESGPNFDSVRLAAGESKEFFVQPMQPKSHSLTTDWTLQILATSPTGITDEPSAPSGGESYVRDERAEGMWTVDGERGAARRANPLPEGKPKGAPQKALVKRLPGGAYRSTVLVEKLPPGVYRLTARVFDDTKVGGGKAPWVIKDPDRLREEWRSWTIEVLPAAAAPGPAPAPDTPK